MLELLSVIGRALTLASAAIRDGLGEHDQLVFDIFRHAPQGGFRCAQVAGGVEGDPFPHGSVGRIHLVAGNEDRSLCRL